MKHFLDAMADAHFVPQDDGLVRFVLPKPDCGYLILTEGEANGVKIFWRPMVRFYVYACHACVLICFIAPWLAFPQLLTLWLVGIILIQVIKHRFKRKVGKDESQYDWVYYQQSKSISRRAAISLGILALVMVGPGGGFVLKVVEMSLGENPWAGVNLLLVAVRWAFYFFGMVLSPRAKQNWAQIAKP